MVDIDQLARDARTDIEAATTVAELEAAKIQHLGKSGPLVLLLRDIKSLPPEERGHVGKNGNRARQELEALVATRLDGLASAELDARLRADAIDVTLPARAMPQGTLHLLTQTRRLLEDIFLGMGYDVVDAPEIENEWYGFTALNTPVGHPARNPSDTFYVHGHDTDAGANDDALILRTQTSTAQLRAMQLRKPPLYVVHPGRVYRRDDIDATHSDMFHQMEALAIDEGLTLAHLKGTIESFLHRLFGDELEVRLRTHFFPFTEPSVEADVQCFSCGGTGDPSSADHASGDFDRCRVCRGEGWIEIMGAGMVDPNVLGMVDGYDPDRLSGFAFGIGIDRVAMLRHGFPDLRLLFQNDLRFVRQFTSRT
ncbi:MAG: Phenylalanine--tRNA ligase alpha subunit [Thermoleophilia bacterium]|nr:Phenylalanine--tRNA ligase alpha subunit [Thermoleophilia bacterium]